MAVVYHATFNGSIYGVSYATGDVVNVTGWTERNLVRAIDRGLIFPWPTGITIDGFNLSDALVEIQSAQDTATAALVVANAAISQTDPRLADARTPTGPAGGVLGGTYPNPSFAVDMATQAELDAVSTVASAAIPLAQKGVANGVATTDSGGKVPVTQLPNSIMEYQGTWNATTNTPTLADGTGNTGDVYRVTVAGTRNLGSGAITFDVGDYAVYNVAGVWEKSDTTDSVPTVFGRTGNVVAADADYVATQVAFASGSGLASTRVGAALDELAAGKQPINSNLTTIGGLDSATAGALVTDGAGWFRKTYAQLKTALGLVQADVGLGNVDNTSDANKPVSTAQLTALNAKIANALVDAKGDLLTATANDTPARFAVGTDGQILTPQAAQTDGLLWRDQTDKQIFTAGGTWNRPSWATDATRMTIILVGAGGQGGAGRRGAAGTVRCGGGGGGSGGRTELVTTCGVFATSETVAVGTGGSAGAAAQTANDTNGATGSAGGNTSFSTGVTVVRAGGGGGGGGGSATNGTAGNLGNALSVPGNAGAGASGTGGAGNAGTSSSNSSAGGGASGGGITAADAASAGAAGGGGGQIFANTTTSGGAVGGAAPTASTEVFIGQLAVPGVGGGSGAASITTAAQAGAAGSRYGAGGGGGGASLNGNNSGAGGAGANGIAIVICG